MGLQISLAGILSFWGLRAVAVLAGFILLAVVFSKTWCGWICPFGTLQDWISSLRKRFSVRESQFSWGLRDKLKSVKYILLGLLLVIPVLIANAGLHSDFKLPFCQICPAKVLMPMFEGNFMYLGVNAVNSITTIMTVISIILAAFFLTGMFFKDRFFCIFCPMLALIGIFDRIGFMRLRKKIDSCIGCGNCQRICPVDIKEVHLEKKKEDVLTQDCVECFKCAEACPQDGALSVKFLKWRIFSSSRKYVAGLFGKRKN